MDFQNRFAAQYPELFIEDRLRGAREYRPGGNGISLRLIGAAARLLRRSSARIESWATRPADQGSASFQARVQAR